MKQTKKILALIIALISLLLILASCDGESASGIYYAYKDGCLDKKDYWVINSNNTWMDSDGVTGTYELDGSKIIIYFLEIECYSGTLENGKLTIEDLEYYLEDKAPTQSPDLMDSTTKNKNESTNNSDSSEGNTTPTSHTHSYGAWTTTTPSTCISEGTQTRSCSCGDIQTQSLAVTEHNYVDYTCTVCGDLSCIVIKTPDDLKKLDNSTETFMLANDIDLAGIDWTPIKSFSGSLIGNGFTIKNLTINASEKWVGLFADLRGTVQNLSIENANVTVTGNYKCIGILCGTLEGKGQISDITVSGNVTAISSDNVGGIVGYIAKEGTYTLKNLESRANVTAKNNVGGIAGYFGDYYETAHKDVTSTLSSLKNSGTIVGEESIGGIIGHISCIESSVSQIIKVSDVQNTGSITGKFYVGGIIGVARSNNWQNSVIENAICHADISAEAYVGCISGYLENVSINNCINEGSTLKATKYYLSDNGNKYVYAGGFVGRGYLASNCTNKVAINYTSTGRLVGGIMGGGYILGSAKMSNLHNTADISGYNYVGGIMGSCDSESSSDNCTLNLSTFTNSGTITASANYAGGIFGGLYSYSDKSSYETAITVFDFQNTGDVKGKLYVGGTIGYGRSNSSKSFIESSSNNANITAEAYVGCIAGELSYISIDNCKNQGSTLNATKYVTVEGVKYAYVGGFVGKGYLINNCTNSVAINYTSGGRYVGGIAGALGELNGLSFKNLRNNATISGASYVGGIIGYIYDIYDSMYDDIRFTFSDCSNSGTISATAEYVGGIFGYLYAMVDYGDCTVSIIDMANTGNITGDHYVGGIIGYGEAPSSNSVIENSSNASIITAEHSVGCIAGCLDTIEIKSCSNQNSTLIANGYYTENGKKYADIGGYVGRGYIVNNCTNTVNINYTGGGRCVGGIAGALGDTTGMVITRTISNLHNTANISGYSYVGGLVGTFYNSWDWWRIINDFTLNIENCSNSGYISGTDSYIGGFIGYLDVEIVGTYSFIIYGNEIINSGAVLGNSHVGGAFGYCKSDSSASVLLDVSNTGQIIGNKNAGEIAGEVISVQFK